MQAAALQDRLYWGLNVAARRIGTSTDAYRPSGARCPLDPANRFLRLPAAFSGPDSKFQHPNGYGAMLMYGFFDAAYTRPGDYLVQEQTVWFIAAQQTLLPVLCVQTNRVLSFSRPVAPGNAGVNNYGGVTATNTTPLLTDWPASVLGVSRGGLPDASLTSDAKSPSWTILLPRCDAVTLCNGDLIADDLGRNAVVCGAELSDLGWRIAARQAIA